MPRAKRGFKARRRRNRVLKHAKCYYSARGRTFANAIEQVHNAWEDAYAGEQFVQLLPAGQFPRTADVLGANTALLGLAVDEAAGRVVVVAAVDNLVKGTAGAAIQSANIALGLTESTGLPVNGVAP